MAVNPLLNAAFGCLVALPRPWLASSLMEHKPLQNISAGRDFVLGAEGGQPLFRLLPELFVSGRKTPSGAVISRLLVRVKRMMWLLFDDDAVRKQLCQRGWSPVDYSSVDLSVEHGGRMQPNFQPDEVRSLGVHYFDTSAAASSRPSPSFAACVQRAAPTTSPTASAARRAAARSTPSRTRPSACHASRRRSGLSPCTTSHGTATATPRPAARARTRESRNLYLSLYK